MEKIKIKYCRVSTDATDEDGKFLQDPSLQIKPIEDMYPESKDAELFIERGSAYKGNGMKRPIFNSIVAKIKNDEVSALYIFAIDRLFRNRAGLVEFWTLCFRHNCKIYSVTQNMLTEVAKMPNGMGDMMIGVFVQIYGWMSENDSLEKGKSVQKAVCKVDGVTKSVLRNDGKGGKKWGRPLEYDEAIINRCKELKGTMSIRKIAATVGIKKSAAERFIYQV